MDIKLGYQIYSAREDAEKDRRGLRSAQGNGL